MPSVDCLPPPPAYLLRCSASGSRAPLSVVLFVRVEKVAFLFRRFFDRLFLLFLLVEARLLDADLRGLGLARRRLQGWLIARLLLRTENEPARSGLLNGARELRLRLRLLVGVVGEVQPELRALQLVLHLVLHLDDLDLVEVVLPELLARDALRHEPRAELLQLLILVQHLERYGSEVLVNKLEVDLVARPQETLLLLQKANERGIEVVRRGMGNKVDALTELFVPK